MARSLPKVPKIDAAPVASAAEIVASGRAAVVGDAAPAQPKPKKPSGAWFRKAKLARERGLAPPPLPGAGSAAPPPPPPPPSNLPPPPPPVAEPSAPAAELPSLRLMPDDVKDAGREAERAAEAQRVEAQRSQLLIADRSQLERRVGFLAQFIFTGAGYALGDAKGEVWPLTPTQEQDLGNLLVEAWPEECAELMREGMMVKLIAVGTIARLGADRWQKTKARRQPAAPASSSTAAPAPAAPGGPPKFAGLPDMRVA